MDFSVAYITCPDLASARSIGRALITERLAACVNILGPTLSFHQEGVVVEAQEYVLLAKTLEDRVIALSRRVEELHEYHTPAILSWKIEGNESFLNWIASTIAQG